VLARYQVGRHRHSPHSRRKTKTSCNRCSRLALLAGLLALPLLCSAAPAIPITHCQSITLPGNYNLAQDLQATDQVCLLVASNDVTIHLEGYSIHGNTSCLSRSVGKGASWRSLSSQLRAIDSDESTKGAPHPPTATIEKVSLRFSYIPRRTGVSPFVRRYFPRSNAWTFLQFVYPGASKSIPLLRYHVRGAWSSELRMRLTRFGDRAKGR
jgi:hypothetical protein